MTIHKCDRCKQEIDQAEWVAIERGYFGNRVILCNACAQPVLGYLAKEGISLSELPDVCKKAGNAT